MPLDPFLEPLLATLPSMPDEIDDFPAFRAEQEAAADLIVDQLTQPGPDVTTVRRVRIPVANDAIDLLIYEPGTTGPHPVHLYLHGGGWIAGSIDDKIVDIFCRERCAGADCVVVSVDYRKAPEHPFPTGLDDAYAALVWVADHADELGVRRDLITVGGGSAGANLAAALALKARDLGRPTLAFQLLEVPALDLTFGLPSHQTLGAGYQLTLSALRMSVRTYLPSPELAESPYASPLKCADLSGLPPAHIMSAEFDPLRDDGETYAKRLNDAGVPSTFTLGAGHIHISPGLTGVMAAARAWRDEVIDVLRRVHGEYR